MALFSKFNIGNYIAGKDNTQIDPSESFNILNYQIITRCNDDGFHPITAPKVEYVEIVLRCDTTPMSLYKWYRLNLCVNGCISVDLPDGDRICNRMIVFEGGQCFFYNEKYKFDQPQHQVTIRITVEKLSIDKNMYNRI